MAIPDFLYLATPYTRFPGGVEAAFAVACKAAAELMTCGVPVFSPIAHTHPIATAGRMDHLDLDLWLRMDAPMMAAASGIIMLQAPTWAESRGMEHERHTFALARKPVFWMDMRPGAAGAVAVEARHHFRFVK